MKKKLFLGMFAAAGMLLATSCSNDELDVQSGNEVQVSFALATEGGIATRAISDGKSADKLVYAVYKLDANGTPVLQNVVGSNEDGQFVKTDFKSGDNVSITLAKGQTYQVAFWAQDGDCKAYDTDDLQTVKVNYKAEDGTDAVSNDELRDAFFKTVEFQVAGNKTIDVVLKRPFAQINVGVDAEDWAAAEASGIKIEKSSVVIKNAANEINLLTGEISGEETVTYVLNTIPKETLYVETDDTKEGKEAYNWLSMNYILVADANETDVDNDGTLGDDRATLESLQFTFVPENGNPIEFKEGLNSVPVQRNWRTNILGKILTGDIQFNITIDPVYDGDIIYPDNEETFAELELAASMGGTVTLDENFKMPEERSFLQVSADFVLNINNDVTFTSGDASNYGIKVTNGTTTINGAGDIKSQGGGIGITDGASLIFNGGNLDVNTSSTSGRYLFYLTGEGSTATINGGNFDFNKTQNQKRAYIYAGIGTTVYVKGGNFGKASTREDYKVGIMGDGKVIITGGTFGFDPTNWLAEGYEAKNIEGKYIVIAKSNESVSSSDDLSNLSGTVSVSEAINYSNKQIRIENNVIFNMGNNEVKAGSASDYGLVADGVYAEFNQANINSLGGGIAATDGANVVFNSGKLSVNTTSTSGRYNIYAVGEGTIVTIKDGEFSFSSTLNQKRAYIYAGSGATVYVKGGNFGEASTRSGYTAGILGEGTVIITGGSFGFDPSAWVASGYTATENNGVWTVSAN